MVEQKIRVVHFLNQFFGQEGGEDKADIGMMVKAGPVGPGILLDRLLGDNVMIINTLICGDNYFSVNVADAVEEAVGRTAELQPDLFFAGPAFHAGRYGIACGALVKAVRERMGIPSVTGMFPENPGVDLCRKVGYIVKTGISTVHMQDALTGMAALGLKLLNNEPIGSAAAEEYIARGFVKNESLEKSGAIRAVDMLLRKVKDEPFESELPLPDIEEIPPAPKVPDMTKARLALVSDGGLVPKGNPDRLKMSQNTIFAAYDIDEFINNPFQIAHSGYHHSQIRENVNRLLPVDVLMEMVEEGACKEFLPVFFSTSGNTTTIESSRNVGKGIAKRLKESGVDAVILTSTWGTSSRCGATISKEIERIGIPAVQISPVVDVAKMIGVSRLVRGYSITSPLGDPGQGQEKEKEMRRKYVEKAIDALQKDGKTGEFLDIE